MTSRVIVIDDIRSLREYTLGVLDRAGFEAFGASDGPTGLESVKKNEETGGTGLGLYTSKLLLKSYHADISIKSLDTGSLFTITIPKTNVFTQRG